MARAPATEPCAPHATPTHLGAEPRAGPGARAALSGRRGISWSVAQAGDGVSLAWHELGRYSAPRASYRVRRGPGRGAAFPEISRLPLRNEGSAFPGWWGARWSPSFGRELRSFPARKASTRWPQRPVATPGRRGGVGALLAGPRRPVPEFRQLREDPRICLIRISVAWGSYRTLTDLCKPQSSRPPFHPESAPPQGLSTEITPPPKG